MRFTGLPVDNTRMAICSDPKVREFISQRARFHRIAVQRYGDRFGAVVLPDDLVRIQKNIARLQEEIADSRSARRAAARSICRRQDAT
jgi:hypothetical protein